MRLRFSLRELETFVAIADYGTFAGAGEAIGLTQSAISLQIKSLETMLGTELFDRSKRPPVMNTQGLKLVSRAREIINLCQALKDDVVDNPLGGALRLGVIPTVMSGVLPKTLLQLRQTHPQLTIELSSGLSAKLVAKVNKGVLDAAIVTEPAQLGRGLSWHAFDEEPLVLIAPQDAQGEIDIELLERYPFIQFQQDTYVGQQIFALLQDRGIKVDLRMNLDSLESIANLVANGLGVSVVPQRSVAQPFPTGVKALPFGRTPAKRVIGVVERVRSPKREFIQVLTETLIEQSA
jgi:DNA-binding transcriptional LysR family regulator